MKQDLGEISSRARIEGFKKMNKALEKQIEAELSDPIALELNQPNVNMWHKIIESYQATVSDGEQLLAKKAKSKNYTI